MHSTKLQTNDNGRNSKAYKMKASMYRASVLGKKYLSIILLKQQTNDGEDLSPQN
jgi:hypothetical protein